MDAAPGVLGLDELAGDEVDAIALQVVGAGAGALVGVGDGAASLQPPFAGRPDRAVDAARARGGRGHDAGVGPIEALRHLHHQDRPVLLVGVAGQRQILVARDQPLAVGHGAVGADVGSVERAVAAAGAGVDQPPVVGVDGAAAQLRGGRAERIGEAWRRRVREARAPEPGGQEVGRHAVVVRAADRAAQEVRRSGRDRGGVGRGRRPDDSGDGEGDRERSHEMPSSSGPGCASERVCNRRATGGLGQPPPKVAGRPPLGGLHGVVVARDDRPMEMTLHRNPRPPRPEDETTTGGW
jgi:hypothetical protein